MNQSNSDLFEAFLKQIPSVIFQLQVHSNGSSKFIFISENIQDIYELNALDVLKEADLLYSRVHPEDLFLKISSLEHSRKTLQKWELEYRVILPSRGVRWLLGVAKPQELSDGSVMFYGYISDITDKKRGEQKLDSAVKNLTRAESTAHIGSWTLDVFYNLLEWSDEFYNILEIDKQIFSPSYQAYFSVIHPDDRKFVGHVYTTSLQTKEKYQIIYRLQMKDGRIKYVQEHCEHEFDNNEKHLFSFGTLQDVTQEQTTKLILENQKNELQAIFETSKDGIAIMDLESKFLDFNDAYLELTGYTREELMQKSCLEMTDPADKERTLGAME